MALSSEIKYETEIKGLKDISPEAVLSMLRDVRVDIGRLDNYFANVDLARVLTVVEAGKYEVNGKVLTRIDLSSAKDVINAYREYSEGGCQSCTDLGRETIDAQDATSGWFCKDSDPDYNPNPRSDKPKVTYSGFSPKVRSHYEKPCDSLEPRFSPKLEVLLETNNQIKTFINNPFFLYYMVNKANNIRAHS